MTETKTAFKLVRRAPEGTPAYAMSYGSISLAKPAIAFYVPGETTLPPLEGTRLFVFDTLLNAARFAWVNEVADNKKFEIWQVEVEDARPLFVRASIMGKSDTAPIKHFWNAEREHEKQGWGEAARGVLATPTGTLSCASVTLVKQVPPATVGFVLAGGNHESV